MRVWYLLAVLGCGFACAADGKRVEVPLAPEGWKAAGEGLPGGRRALAWAVHGRDGLAFSVQSRIGEPRSMRWGLAWNADLSGCQYTVLEYRARWLLRSSDKQEALLALAGGPGVKPVTATLVKVSELIDDGRWHRLLVRRPLPERVREIRVALETRDSRGEFSIRRLACLATLEGLPCALAEGTSKVEGEDAISPVELSDRYDTGYDALVERLLARADDPIVQDGGRYFSQPSVRVEGIPFRVRPKGHNLVGPPPRSKVNEEWIENFGLRVRRGQVAPVSRDDVTQVAINRPASEVYLLLAAEMPTKQKAYFVCERPKTLSDVESLAVELRYADGTVDLAFPYSLSDRTHTIQRTLAVYAVPANGGVLQAVAIRNRSLAADVYLAALSVNSGTRRICPEPVEPPQTMSAVKKLPPRPPYARRDEGTIVVGNAGVELAIDAAGGFALRRLINRWIPDEAIQVSGGPGLEIGVRGATLSPGEMRLVDVTPRRAGWMLSYASANPKIPLDWTIAVSAESTAEVRLQLAVTSHATETLKANIRFPNVTGLRIRAPGDLWYMFPQYDNTLGNHPVSLSVQAGFAFPMQFMDFFSPRLGGGVFLQTEDRSHRAQRYGLSKSAGAGSMFIEYPATFTELEPGATVTFSPTVLGVHPGDWHAAAERYRRWVAGWYRPYKSQDKNWYRESFWLLAEIADGLDPDTYRLPAWYDAKTRHFRMRDIVAEFQRVSGRRPDILHFWSWAYSEADAVQRWGEYGGADYEALGGLRAWREALDDIQQNLKIPVSLYVNATLCNRSTPVGQRLGPTCAMRLPTGQPMIPYPNSYRMCHGTKAWTDYMKELYPRLERDTGAAILYVDETSSRAMCFARDHGHQVPLNCSRADDRFLRAVREATPAHVALYGEYPNIDDTSQYSDCNINYYFMAAGRQLFCPNYDEQSPDEGLAPVPLNLYRYLFPRIVQLDLPLGMRHTSWNDLKFTFFHGEAIYDSYWDRDETRGHAFMVRAYDLKRQYRDCFTSNRPEMLVPTEQSGLSANRFPGRGRTLWTLYNRRYTTLRGPALRVDHVAGASYRDAWNDRPLPTELRGGKALIRLALGPQEIGCVVQSAGP